MDTKLFNQVTLLITPMHKSLSFQCSVILTLCQTPNPTWQSYVDATNPRAPAGKAVSQTNKEISKTDWEKKKIRKKMKYPNNKNIGYKIKAQSKLKLMY